MNTVSAYGQSTIIGGARKPCRSGFGPTRCLHVGLKPDLHASLPICRLTAVKAGGLRSCHPRAMATATLTADLLRRYDRAGPRYTSYPTAPHFSAAFDERALREAARETNGDPIPRPLSLYVHVPFCTSPCFYCGCNRIITRDKSRGGRLPRARSTARSTMAAAMFDRDREVVQLHFGGGTPNFLSPAQLREVVETLRRHFPFHRTRRARPVDRARSAHASTPRDVRELAAIGFNRASLGVQDFDPAVQAAVNRVQSVERDARGHRRLPSPRHALGQRRPHLRPAEADARTGSRTTLDTVIAARPDRLAVYGYAHLPQTLQARSGASTTRDAAGARAQARAAACSRSTS